MSGFRLYPIEQRWWSMADYAAVLDVMARVPHRTALEFGPGSSTLALVEGGAEHIDSCEDSVEWFDVYGPRLAKYSHVTLHLYEWSVPVKIPALDKRQYDMALIDGPHGTLLRPAAIEYSLQRCAAVLVPTEEWRDGRIQPDKGLRPAISVLAAKYERAVEFMETGPLSGAFALMT